MKTSEQVDKLIAEQAAEWTERLARGDERDMAAFAEWSRKSPQHMRQFLMMMALERELTQIDPEKKIELPIAEDSAEVISLGKPLHIAGKARRPRRWALAAAVGSIVIGAATYLGVARSGWETFSTAQGEQRAVELADGSIMHLNTLSRAKVRMTEAGRDIRLVEGEALFKVAKEVARPFRVHTTDAIIQAVGTQFNVYAQHGVTKVSVLEGRVQVSSADTDADAPAPQRPVLGAGAEAKVDTKGVIRTARVADTTSLATWRQRRLVFNQNPLSEVVTEFNRYNRTPQFRVMDQAIASRPYSGAFDADDPESLVELLRLDAGLEIEVKSDEILIREHQSPL